MFFNKNELLCNWIEKNNNLHKLLFNKVPNGLLKEVTGVSRYCNYYNIPNVTSSDDFEYISSNSFIGYKYLLLRTHISYNKPDDFYRVSGTPCYFIFELRTIKTNIAYNQSKIYIAFKTNNLKKVHDKIIENTEIDKPLVNIFKIVQQDNINYKFNDLLNAILTKIYLLSNVLKIFDTDNYIENFCNILDKRIKSTLPKFNLEPDYYSMALIDDKLKFTIKDFVNIAKLTINDELITTYTYNPTRNK